MSHGDRKARKPRRQLRRAAIVARVEPAKLDPLAKVLNETRVGFKISGSVHAKDRA